MYIVVDCSESSLVSLEIPLSLCLPVDYATVNPISSQFCQQGLSFSLSAGSSGSKGALTIQPYCQRGWNPRTWVPAFPMAGIWPGEPSALPLWPDDSYFFLFFLILPGVWSKSSNYDNNTLVRATQDLIYCKAMMNCWVCVATRYSYSILCTLRRSSVVAFSKQ